MSQIPELPFVSREIIASPQISSTAPPPSSSTKITISAILSPLCFFRGAFASPSVPTDLPRFRPDCRRSTRAVFRLPRPAFCSPAVSPFKSSSSSHSSWRSSPKSSGPECCPSWSKRSDQSASSFTFRPVAFSVVSTDRSKLLTGCKNSSRAACRVAFAVRVVFVVAGRAVLKVNVSPWRRPLLRPLCPPPTRSRAERTTKPSIVLCTIYSV